MCNGNVSEAVSPTSIGGKYPECLGSVITFDCPSALGTLLCHDLGQDASIDFPSHNLIGVLAGGDNSAFTVNNISAHLHGRQPTIDITLARADRRCLSFDYSHETRDGSKIRGNGNGLMRGNQFVELGADASLRRGACWHHLDDVASNLAPCPDPRPSEQRNVLHNPARDHLARSAFGGRNGRVQANRQY